MTKRGQLAIEVRECTLLAKALRDPPDLFHGISDPEVRYRQRELDLMANERSREIFALRAKVVAAIRDHMNERGYVEMETPILQRMTGGAAARPFKTHHHALDRHLYLRIATELYLKRAIVGGFENVYELGKFFRNEGMSPQHNPEFTMLEWFVSGADYHGVMDVAEGIVSDVAQRVLGTTKVERDGETIDLAPPWPRVRLQDALLEETGVDITKASRDELAELAGEDADPDDDWAGAGRHPAGQADRAEADPADLHRSTCRWRSGRWSSRSPSTRSCSAAAFDGIVAGMEITGGGTDVNDPIEQRRHFVEQRERQESGAEETPHEHDEEFVRALEYGMLTASGSRARRRPADDDPQRREDAARRDPLPVDARGARPRAERLARSGPGAPARARPGAWCGGCRTRARSGSASSRRARWQSASRLDDDVGGEGRELGGDLPDVQVVDLDHARLFGHPAADPLGVDPLRRGLEEDPAGVAQQAVGRAQHQAGDQQRGDRVGPLEAGQQDHRGGDRGADEGEEVGEEVLEAALDVEALAVGAGEGRRWRRG